MHRMLIGIFALVLLAISGGIFVQGLAQEYTVVLSGCLRTGLLLGAVWLAYEQIHEMIRRTPPWMIGGIGICLVVVVVRPRVLLALLPLLVGAVALHLLGRFLRP